MASKSIIHATEKRIPQKVDTKNPLSRDPIFFLMVFLFKGVLLASVLLTAGSALVDGSLPYFPIEVSRLAASSMRSAWIFRIGSILSSLVLFYEKGLWEHLVACFGFVLLAWFDDTHHYVMHVVGVVVMLLGAIPLVSWRVQLCAMILFVARILMKCVMVISKESLFQPRLVFDQLRSIMLFGTSSEDTLMVFRVTGALQWVVFYLYLIM